MPDHRDAGSCSRCGVALPDNAAFCPSCGDATPSGAGGPASPAGPTGGAAAARHARIAAALGPGYDLGDILGVGGFAEVYAAVDRRLKRRVAVKVLRAEIVGDAAVRERFRREAEAVAQLRHPHVVPVYAVGEDGDLAWFVMPLLEGETLASALERETRWSFPEVCRILREAASALAEAHRRGMVHRDVKPDNIMLDGPDRRVVVMDFGIAKVVDEHASSLTATGMLVGSPHFMSPEQSAGDAVDALSDQYSLALVGYRMLTGRLPFEADSARALLFKQATEQPAAPETLRPDTPPPLSRVIMRGLAKERSARFAGMREFETAVTNVAAEVAGGFRRQRTVPPLEERWATALAVLRGRPWRYAVAAIVGLLLFGYAYPRSESRGAREVLGARDTALATDRMALRALGAPDVSERIYLAALRDVYRFVQETEDPVSAESLAVSAGTWFWGAEVYRNVPYLYARATADARGRLLEAQNFILDSVTLPSVSPDSALRLALAFTRYLGHDAATLGAPRTTEQVQVGRRDYGFAWTLPSVFPARGRDSVSTTLSVRVTGDRVTRAVESLDAPEPSTFELSNAAMTVVGNVASGIIMVLVFIALGAAARRAAFDTIQWGTTFRLGVAFLVVHAVTAVLPSVGPLSRPFVSVTNLAEILGDASRMLGSLATLGPAMMLLIFLAAAESWLNDARPELAAGLTDLSRLRVRTPEVLMAVPAGIAWGIGLAAARAASGLGGRYWLHLPVEPWTAIPSIAVRLRWPMVGVLGDLWMTAMAIPLVVFLVAAGIRMRRAWLAPVSAALLWAGLTVAVKMTGVYVWQALLDGLLAGLTALLVLRSGILAGALALFTATMLPTVYDLFWAGGPFRAAGIAGVVLLLLPPALGVLIWLQRPRAPVPAPIRRSRPDRISRPG